MDANRMQQCFPEQSPAIQRGPPCAHREMLKPSGFPPPASSAASCPPGHTVHAPRSTHVSTQTSAQIHMVYYLSVKNHCVDCCKRAFPSSIQLQTVETFSVWNTRGSSSPVHWAHGRQGAHGPQPPSGAPMRGLRLPNTNHRPHGWHSGNLFSCGSGGHRSESRCPKAGSSWMLGGRVHSSPLPGSGSSGCCTAGPCLCLLCPVCLCVLSDGDTAIRLGPTLISITSAGTLSPNRVTFRPSGWT